MASSLEECDKMLKAAADSGKTLAVIAQNRFRTTIMSLKNILTNSLLAGLITPRLIPYGGAGTVITTFGGEAAGIRKAAAAPLTTLCTI